MGIYFNTHDDDFEDDLTEMSFTCLGKPVSLTYDYDVDKINALKALLGEDNFEHNIIEQDKLVKFIDKGDRDIYIFDVAGISKEDLSVKLIENEDFKEINIKGTTKNEMLDEELSFDYNIEIDMDIEIKEIISKLENGLLYVEIEYQEPENTGSVTTIEIQ